MKSKQAASYQPLYHTPPQKSNHWRGSILVLLHKQHRMQDRMHCCTPCTGPRKRLQQTHTSEIETHSLALQ